MKSRLDSTTEWIFRPCCTDSIPWNPDWIVRQNEYTDHVVYRLYTVKSRLDSTTEWIYRPCCTDSIPWNSDWIVRLNEYTDHVVPTRIKLLLVRWRKLKNLEYQSSKNVIGNLSESTFVLFQMLQIYFSIHIHPFLTIYPTLTAFTASFLTFCFKIIMLWMKILKFYDTVTQWLQTLAENVMRIFQITC